MNRIVNIDSDEDIAIIITALRTYQMRLGKKRKRAKKLAEELEAQSVSSKNP